jgi:hypothetical protein
MNGSCISTTLSRNLPGETKENSQSRPPLFQPGFEPDTSSPRGRSTIAAVTKLHASRPRKDFTPRAALRHQYSVTSFATLRVLSCLHSPGFRCSCCKVVRYCCVLEACNLVTSTITTKSGRGTKTADTQLGVA